MLFLWQRYHSCHTGTKCKIFDQELLLKPRRLSKSITKTKSKSHRESHRKKRYNDKR